MPMSKVFPGIEQTEIYQAIAETFETGRSRRILNEFVLVDGTIRHYDLRLSSVPDGVLIISDEIREEEDIEFYIESAWRHWKEQAESYQQTLRKVLDSSFAGVQYFKSIRCESGDIVDFEYIFSNEAACEIIGHTEEFLVGRRLLEVLPGHSANRSELGETLLDLYADVVETGKPKSLLFHYDADGITEWFMTKSVKLDDGFVVTFSVVTELVSKTKELEELNRTLQEKVTAETEKNREKDLAIIQQSKLAAMGEMLAAIAHQWRQPLNSIQSGTLLIEEIVDVHSEKFSEADRSEVQELLTFISERCGHLSQTIDDFRSFYSPSDTVQFFSLESVVASVLKFCEGELLQNGVQCSVKLEDFREISLCGNANQLTQVLVNLIGNAIDSLKYCDSKERQICISHEGVGPDRFSLHLWNNGPPIDSAIVKDLFKPYVSTKGPAAGHGMGLYICRLIMERTFRGDISFQSNDEGVQFNLHFPFGREQC